MTLAPRDCIARVDCCGSQPTLHSMLRSMSKQCSINSSVTAHSIIALHDTYKYTAGIPGIKIVPVRGFTGTSTAAAVLILS